MWKGTYLQRPRGTTVTRPQEPQKLELYWIPNTYVKNFRDLQTFNTDLSPLTLKKGET